MFDGVHENACNIFGRNNGLESWTWDEYKIKKEKLGEKIILCDMINHPVLDAVQIKEDFFTSGEYTEGTIFVLYCHSGGSSGYLQSVLSPRFPQYKFVNLTGGVISFLS